MTERRKERLENYQDHVERTIASFGCDIISAGLADVELEEVFHLD
jgi:hypothetical protein